MIQITDELVGYLADLSKLQYNEEQTKSIKGDLQQIISFMEKLEEINTDGVEPLIHISGRTNVLRADDVQGSMPTETALQNAPAADGTPFFKVPKVISK